MTLTGLIIFLLIGAVAGWLAGVIIKGVGFGLVGNIALPRQDIEHDVAAEQLGRQRLGTAGSNPGGADAGDRAGGRLRPL